MAQTRGAHPVPPELLQKAWDEGSVRVIVELGGARVEPESRLSGPSAVAAQRSRIAADRTALRSALRGLRHRVLRELRTIPYVGLEVDHDALRILDTLPGLVTGVYESKSYAPMLAQSGPLIKTPDAWNAGWDGNGQVIAILDTGVDKNHPFLAGKVVSEACYDSSLLSTCPNGLNTDTSSGAGMHCTFAPECFHGTSVAGIAAGNGSSFDGVARGANLVSIRVFSLSDCFGVPCATAWDMDIAHGLERVLELSDTLPIAAANLSLGRGFFFDPCDFENPMVTAAIVNLRAAGVATIASSGNDGSLFSLNFPACISTAISVGATSDGSGGLRPIWSWPSRTARTFLSLLAPGFLINSSVPGGGFMSDEGTSLAAPHVAGAWAIAKQANPGASVDDVLFALRNTGKPIVDPGNGLTFYRITATLLQFSASNVQRGGDGHGHHHRDAVGRDVRPSLRAAQSRLRDERRYRDPKPGLHRDVRDPVFNKGETSKTFTVQIAPDSKDDGTRTVNLTLTNAGGGALLGARDTAVLNIADNDVGGSIQFSAGHLQRE